MNWLETFTDHTSVSFDKEELTRLRNGFLMRIGQRYPDPHPDDLALRNKLDRAIARLDERATWQSESTETA